MPVFGSGDGVLEYERHGDPGALPVLLHHGLLGSAGVPEEWHRLARGAGVGLVAVARPGYGRSAPAAMGSIGDWPRLVAPLLDALGVDRCGVLGVSAGAPYGYALAAAAPERVTSVAVLPGLGLVDEAVTRGCYPAEPRQLFEEFARGDEEATRRYWAEQLTDGLAEFPADHPWRRALVDSLAHEAAGPGREARLQQCDWGFALGEAAATVGLWHSRTDTDVPFATAEIIASRLPAATLHEVAAPGHIPTPAAVAAALAFLTAAAATPASTA
ncbi:alpha/beta fold hydrolase [Streptomyces lonarensis]|uniref:Alpha/beta hydrolase n=1 Tax=Streptomyces lonarensis TaxID=700599 RepID=A0A7X6D2W3_9ACTN|nr:alpha/beta hydrolase [Streptomyces lonarensis]NJQ07206.1 alpha/beta hydrolase [Streptomyces lonarensis]